MTRREVRQGVEKIRDEAVSDATDVLTCEVPRRKLSVAGRLGISAGNNPVPLTVFLYSS